MGVKADRPADGLTARTGSMSRIFGSGLVSCRQ